MLPIVSVNMRAAADMDLNINTRVADLCEQKNFINKPGHKKGHKNV